RGRRTLRGGRSRVVPAVITVGVSGAAGRMGRLAAEAIRDAADLELGGLYAPGHAGETVAGTTCADDPAALGSVDVVVELTRPDVVMDNMDAWRANGSHVVVGTSGFDADRLAGVRRTWGSGPPNCLIVPNFSVGA